MSDVRLDIIDLKLYQNSQRTYFSMLIRIKTHLFEISSS